MTTTTMTFAARPADGLFSRIGAAIVAIYFSLSERSYLAACAAEAEALFALSDAELAARGLDRKGILPHAFGGYLAL